MCATRYPQPVIVLIRPQSSYLGLDSSLPLVNKPFFSSLLSLTSTFFLYIFFPASPAGGRAHEDDSNGPVLPRNHPSIHIHCYLGLSRSLAVASALCHSGTQRHPHRSGTCSRVLLRATGSAHHSSAQSTPASQSTRNISHDRPQKDHSSFLCELAASGLHLASPPSPANPSSTTDPLGSKDNGHHGRALPS